MDNEAASALARDRVTDITTTGRKGHEPTERVADSPLVEVTFGS